MPRRWAPPKPKTPQQELRLEQRGRFTPAIKLQPETAIAAGESIGLKRSGDLPVCHPRVASAKGPASSLPALGDIGNLASAMVGVLERHTARQRLGGVMLALTVRKEVHDYLSTHPDGATADEIAEAIRRTPFTVRPRVSELLRKGLIADSGRRRANTSGRSAIVDNKDTG